MAIAPVWVEKDLTIPAKYNLLDTVGAKATSAKDDSGKVALGGAQYQSDYCGPARPFNPVCVSFDLGDISVSVDDASVATITSTGLADGTYLISWGDGDETPSEAEQLNETHDYSTAGDGSYTIRVYNNAGGSYAEVAITVEDGVVSGPFTADVEQIKIADDGITTVVGEPIPVYHLFSCRLVGDENGADRAKVSLDLGASRALEQGFQTVFATGALNITPAAPVDPVRSLGLLEQYAGQVYGGRPVIHMDRKMATRLIAAMAVYVVGDHLETALGSLVVAGAGYNSDASLPSAPGAGNDWMYATGAVHIWQSAKDVIIPTVLDTPYTNEYKALAERTYVPTFECFSAAIKVTE